MAESRRTDYENLTEQLLGLPEIAAQKRFLEANVLLLNDDVACALKKQADHLMHTDNWRAQRAALLLLHLAECTGDPLQRALGLLAEANVMSIGFGEYKEAIPIYDEAARIYQSQGRPVEHARSQVGKIWSLTNLGRYAKALEVGEWAGRVLEDHAEWQVLATLTMNLGIVHARAGNDAGALEMFDRAAALYRQLGAESEAAWLHVQQNRAVILRILGRFDESIRASQTAWEGLDRLGQQIPAARARQNLALTYFVLGRYNEALEQLDHVRDVFMADGRQRDAMLVELDISGCLLQLRRFGDVLDKCVQVRTLFTALGTQQYVAQAVVNEAVAYAELGRFSEALNSLSEAHRIFEEQGNHTWVASTDLQMATVYLRQGQAGESQAVAMKCATVFRAHDLPIEEAQARLVAARAAFALNLREQALRLTTQVLKVAEQRDVPDLKYRCHHILGALAAAQGQPRDALDAFDRAIEEVERLRGRLMVEFRTGFLEDKEGIYEDAVALCLSQGQPLRGLEYAERAKSRALLDLLSYRLDLGIQARNTTDRPLVEQLLHLRAERDRLYRRWENIPDGDSQGWSTAESGREQARQEVLALEKRIAQLWHRLLVHNADYAREAALWTVRTEPIQPFLGSDTILVEYFITHGKFTVFLVTSGGVQGQQLECDLTQIQRWTQLLWLNLKAVPRSDPNRLTMLTTNAQGLLQQLHRLLLAPFADVLDSYHRLIIVPHGPLHYLPIHALYDGGSFLLEQHEISYLPGASFLRYCHDARPADTDLIAVGHSRGGRLPQAVREAGTVAAILEGRAILENDATLDTVQRAATECSVLHMATHGDFRPDNPLFSGLALADGWLTTLDIFNLRLHASLVTLSACQTGRSVIGGGDELLGLMRAFLCAGAASLVLSLWAVEDRSTAQLMETFYRKMAAGWSKGSAIRHAQLQLLRGQEGDGGADYRHPYFWAPFFLVGDSGTL